MAASKGSPSPLGLDPAALWRCRQARGASFSLNLSALCDDGAPRRLSVVFPVGAGTDLVVDRLRRWARRSNRSLEIVAAAGTVPERGQESIDGAGQEAIRVRILKDAGDNPVESLWRGLRAAGGEFVTWVEAPWELDTRQLDEVLRLLETHPHWDALGLVSKPPAAGRRLAAGDVARRPWLVPTICVYRRRALGLLLDKAPPCTSVLQWHRHLWIRACFLLNAVVRPAASSRGPYAGPPLPSQAAADGWKSHGPGGADGNRYRIRDDFVRDFVLSPLAWHVQAPGGQSLVLAEALRSRIRAAGHRLIASDRVAGDLSCWTPVIEVRIREEREGGLSGEVSPPRRELWSCRAVVVIGRMPQRIEPGWDLCLAFGASLEPRDLSGNSGHGFTTWDLDTLFTAIDIRARSLGLARLEQVMAADDADRQDNGVEATVVICTHRKIPSLRDSIRSVCCQGMDRDRYEILLVNNNPDDGALSAVLQGIRGQCIEEGLKAFRIIEAPLPGLSHARNAAVLQARGAVVLFLDDDAVAPVDWVERMVKLFHRHPRLGVIGGAIRLRPPQPRPRVLHPGWERYWSHFIPDHQGFREVHKWWHFPWGANWAAQRRTMLEMGGFRCRYGRVGDDFSGGEEIIAARLAQELGYAVGVAADVEVEHRVAPCRFTYRHVRRTIIAGELVNYQAYRDGHFPGRITLTATLKKLFKLRERGVRRDASIPVMILHWIFWKEAWWRLFCRQLRDRMERKTWTHA